MQPNVRPARVESLTGLRWFAAFGVFAYHANQVLVVPRIGEAMRLGDAGVTFFYVLSGFVLTWSFSPLIGARTFWWRRFARVWPMLALSLPIAWISFGESMRAAWLPSLAGLTLVESWLRPLTTLVANPVSWSVSCEAFFYLVFPFLIRPLLRLRLPGLAVLAATLLAFEVGYWYLVVNRLVPPGAPNYWVGISWFIRFPPYRLAEFCLGMVTAAALLRGWRPRLNLWLALATVAVSAAVLIYGVHRGWWLDLWSQQGLLISCILVVIAAVSRDTSGRSSFLASRPLVALGKWSYAFYLVHLSMIHLVLRVAPGPYVRGWAKLGIAGVWALLAVLLAALCYQFVEHPLETWLRRLYPSRARHAGARRPAVGESAVSPHPLPATETPGPASG